MKKLITPEKPFVKIGNGFQKLKSPFAYIGKGKTYSILMLLSCIVFFAACKKDNAINNAEPEEITANKPDLVFYGLTNLGQVLKYNAMDPAMPISSAVLTGLQSGEKILAIDFRPATGQLYGVGSSSRIYAINYETGSARAIGAGPFTPVLDGEVAAFDFNPTVDRIRLVTNTGQNLRLNPETGMVAVIDGSINGVSDAMVSAVAYSGNKAGSAATILYDIDVKTQKLYRQDPPNAGTLVEIGSLQQEITGEGGFDISPDGIALATLWCKNKSTLFQIDLETGKASKLGDHKDNILVGLAIPTEPVAYAVCNTNDLLIFNPTNPEPVMKPIIGLQPNEKIVGLDMRPANGQLYALGNTCRIYTINASNGAATMLGTMPLSPSLNGKDFGFDFNPVVDRIRVVSNTGQNLRLNPETGEVAATDGNLNPGTPFVTAAAYSNNFAGTTATALYAIDTSNDKLFKQMPPNDGTLVEIGALGVNAEASNGFDIGGTSGKAYAILTVAGSNKIYEINLGTGAATTLSGFPKTVRGMTLGLGF